MVARAAKLCGMDTARDEAAVRDTLSVFPDYVKVAGWGRADLAFCYDSGILDDSVDFIHADEKVLRCEIAQMVYNLMDAAKLL